MLRSTVSRSPATLHPTATELPISQSLLELVVFVGDSTEVHPLPPRGTLSIGRSDDNDIRIDHPSVSRRHARLHLEPGLWIEDLGGRNGTYLHHPDEAHNAKETQPSTKVKESEKVEFDVGDCITFGSVTSVIHHRTPRPRLLVSDEAPSSGSADRARVVLFDPVMLALYEQADRAAESLLSVLLLGETGVGKEVLAQTIHLHSPRAAGPFLALNCAALPESLLEGELFGHDRGTFTGASQARPGLFESAEGGTLFLDEAGDLPMSVQVKLLRVLEERQILRLGERRPRPINVRFIAATNCDLKARVASGAFRRDLFFRLAGWTLTIPPLRERVADIAPLARLFAAKARRELEHSTPASFAVETIALLERHLWPGNVRELRNVVERAVASTRGGEIRPDHLACLDEETASPPSSSTGPSSSPRITPTLPMSRLSKGSVEER
jgi:transcriptional regulator with PAS, ATPase and Fis domain